MRRWWWWCVVVSAAVLVVVQGTMLRCNGQCTCKDQKMDYKHEFTVDCNASTLVEATMTEELLNVLQDLTKIASPRAIVSVEGGASLTLNVTLAFLLRWREFSTCSLEVRGAARVVFPTSMPLVRIKKSDHHYISLRLMGVSASAVPAGFFSGKLAAGLLLNNTRVGLLPEGLFSGVSVLYSLHIVNSTVGVMEGPLGDDILVLHTTTWQEKEEPVKIVNSTVGLLSGGALHLKMKTYQRAMLQGLSLGRVASGAIQVEGGEVVVENCMAARVEAAAILLTKKARLLLRNNWLALQPHALTQLSCSEEGHRMYDNHFSVLLNGTVTLFSLTTNGTAAPPGAPLEEEIAEREQLANILSTAIHPTCTNSNLAPLPPQQSLPRELPPLTSTKMVQFGLIGLFVGLIMGGLILLCYKCWSRCLRRPRKPRCDQPVMVQPIVMSQIPQEPIYEECLPPPLPDLPPPSRREECSASTVENRLGRNTVENEYLVMTTPQQRHRRGN